jgi:hypothetical protein
MLPRYQGYVPALFTGITDGELVHPVEEFRTIFDIAFQVAGDTGNEFLAGKEPGGINRAPFGLEDEGLDPVLPELDTLDQAGIEEFFDDTGTFPAVNSKDLPEITLENPFLFLLDHLQRVFS